MKIEDQLTSLELSKKLKELGLKQESCFFVSENSSEIIYNATSLPSCFISAFSVAELHEILPHRILKDKYFYLQTGKYIGTEMIKYRRNTDILCYSSHKQLVGSYAKMITFLIEKNLVSEEWRKQWLI